MQRYSHLLQALVDGLGWVLLPALVATCVVSAWLLITALRRLPARRAFSATLTAVTLVAALVVVRVEHSWSKIIALTSEAQRVDPNKTSMHLAEALSHLILTLWWAPTVLLAALLVVAFALIREHKPSVTRSVSATATLLVWLSAAFVSHAFDSLTRGFQCGRDCVYDRLLYCIGELHRGQITVSVAAALSCVVSLIWFRRKLWLAAPTQLGRAGSALLVLGLAAFLATRSVRWDASHPVPLDAPNVVQCPLSPVPEASLPLASTDCLAIDAPALALVPEAVLIDGTRFTQPAQVGKELQRKADLWRQLFPGQSFSGTLTVLAPTQTDPRELQPWLSAAQQAGFSSLAVFMRAPRESLPSKTLGTLQRQRCCARRVALSDSAATAFTHFSTWGEVALAIRDSALAISLH